MAIGDVYRLRLETIAAGGDALGRFEGKTVFAEGGAPDETVCCRIIEERKTWARGEILEIIEPSPLRIKSICPFYDSCGNTFGKCGGCNLSHIDYNSQLALKVSILMDSFLRIGLLHDASQLPQPEVFPSPPWEYRNRMQFHCFRQQAKGKDSLKYGLMGRRSREIIPVNDCPVAVPGIRNILNSSQGKEICLPVEKDRFTVFSKDQTLLIEGSRRNKGRIKLLDKEIFVDAGLFFQSNCFMLEKLVLELRETAENAQHNLPMADLYCGAGTFALFLGQIFPKVILAEENKSAISLARENLSGINAEFIALRDNEWQQCLLRKKEAFGFAVVDPPRAGLSPKLALALAQNGPPVLAYVSCAPPALARDSKILADGGYKLQQLKLFDFYPQTAHIETLAVFIKERHGASCHKP